MMSQFKHLLLLVLTVVQPPACFILPFIVVPVVHASSSSSSSSSSASSSVSSDKDIDCEQGYTKLKSDDERLVRFDATEHTVEQQKIICPKILETCGIAPVVSNAASIVAGSNDKKQDVIRAMQIVSLCVTDNPTNRALLNTQTDFFKAVLQLISSKNSGNDVLSAAAELIYHIVFANPIIHAQLVDAVPALSTILLQSNVTGTSSISTSPVVQMWAAAALANLSANYCEEEGWCYWIWVKQKGGPYELLVDPEFTVMVDAASVRQTIYDTPGLVEALLNLTCGQKAITGEPTIENPHPGDNALDTPEHRAMPQIVTWATAGLLRNLALLPQAKKALSQNMICACRLGQSMDWLESVKAQGWLYHLRRADPCWFENDEDDEEDMDDDQDMTNAPLCVDHEFSDATGVSCISYHPETVTSQVCQTPDQHDRTLLAAQACCGCGGGMKDPENPANFGISEEL